jgi:hypothetical protein
MLADLVRLILLILFLPIILLFIGPLLILAVLRGYQPLGPITLDTSRYGAAGRTGALVLGIVLWLVVWGGLAWFVLYAFSPPDTISSVPTPLPTSTPSQDTPTFTPIPPTPTLVTLVELTALPATATPAAELNTPTAAPTPTPVAPVATVAPTISPSPTSGATSTPALTPTPPPDTPTITPSAIATRTTTPVEVEENQATATVTILPQATLSLAERESVVEVVKEGNILLQEAISQAEDENLQSLETIWRNLAFQVAQRFATEIYEQYSKPVVVEFEYLELPTVDRQSTYDEVTVTSRERWAYGGPTKIDREEVFDFIYILTREDDDWIISRYTYRNVSLSAPAPSPTKTPTSTAAVSEEG